MIKFKPCECQNGDLRRVRRPLWVRILFRSRRLYSCAHCGGRFLLPSTHGGSTGGQEGQQDRARRSGVMGVLVVSMLAIAGAIVWRIEAVQPRVAPVMASSVPATGSCQREHIYKAGETFDDIATEELGAAWRWQEIAVLNRKALDDAFGKDGLLPGSVLLIPVACVH